jgi:hypothetical protein
MSRAVTTTPALPRTKTGAADLERAQTDDGTTLASSKVLVAMLLAAGSLVPLLLGGLYGVDLSSQVLFSSIWVILLCLAALRLLTGLSLNVRGISTWRLGPWYLLWSAFAFGLASLTWLGPQFGSAQRIQVPSVVHALSIFGVSVVLWTAGYLVGPPGVVRVMASRGMSAVLHGTAPTIRGGVLPLVLFGVGNASRVATTILTDRLGYVGDASLAVSKAASYTHALDLVSWLAVYAIAAAAYQVFNTPGGKGKITLCGMIAVDVCFGALAGTKQSFVITLLAVLIPYGALRRKISLRLLVPGTLIFLFVVVPFNAEYRSAVRGQQGNLSPAAAIAGAPDVVSNVLDSNSSGNRLVDSSDRMLRRIRNIDNIAIIVQRTPEAIPYRSPMEFVTAPILGFVPRAIWPGKPLMTSGYQFSQEYYQLPSNVYTSTAIPPIGDLYRHGGWGTMMIGAVLIGMAFRLFDGLFQPERDPRAIFFLLVFLPPLVQSEVDIFSNIATIPSSIVAAALGVHLLCRPVKVKPSGANVG